MKLWTYQEAEIQIRQEMDLQDDDNFIANEEMVGRFNSAIDELEGEIVKVNEDYLLTSSAITFVQSASDITLPTDIYAQKIRAFIYSNGTKIYPIRKFRDPEKFYKKAQMDYYATGETEYSYIVKSVSEAQDKIVLTPAAQESGSVALLWYIRNAKRIPKVGESSATRATQLACILDLPEAMNAIFAHVRLGCVDKEKDYIRYARMEKAWLYQKQTFIDNITNRTPDNEDTIPMDTSFYEDFS